ncbi:MAG: thiamine phosphate synthase [Thermodesulfovibrionales bacterium]
MTVIRPPVICAITKVGDNALLDNVTTALKSGVRWIQYRQKLKSRRQMYNEVLEIRKVINDFGAILTVNDHIDIAMAVGADFVHLGQDDIPLQEARKIIPRGMGVGISTHNLDEVLSAVSGGADYIGFGPIFHTNTKDAGLPKGIDALKGICQMVNIPVIAIGGIDASNISGMKNISKLCGVAISSGIFDGDIAKNVKTLTQRYIIER